MFTRRRGGLPRYCRVDASGDAACWGPDPNEKAALPLLDNVLVVITILKHYAYLVGKSENGIYGLQKKSSIIQLWMLHSNTRPDRNIQRIYHMAGLEQQHTGIKAWRRYWQYSGLQCMTTTTLTAQIVSARTGNTTVTGLT